MKENFVSFDLAKKLKEKGFTCDMPFAMYNELGKLHLLTTSAPYNVSSSGYKYREYYDYNDFDEYDCVAPTISQVLKWLRDEKKIFVVVCIDDDSDCPVTYNIFRETDCVHHHHGKYFALSEWSKCEMEGIEYVTENLI